jgi:acyl carrier protein
MNREEALKKVAKVVEDTIGVAPAEITEAASFTNDLGADSLDSVELIMALEEEFGVEIPDTDAENIKTVGQAIDYILTHKK